MSMTESEQEKIFKKFMKVVDTRDSQKIDKALYNHLHLRTGFIAHYNLHGFRDTYAGRGFLDFVDHFERCFYACYGPFGVFNERLKRYILEQADTIRQEFALMAKQKELAQLQSLAQKHGYTVMQNEGAGAPTLSATLPVVACAVSKDGQYMFAI